MSDPRTIRIKDPNAEEWAENNILNLSGYVNDKILEDMGRDVETKKKECNDMKVDLFQSFMLLFLGVTLLVSVYGYYSTSVLSFFTVIMLGFSVFSVALLLFYLYINLKKYKRIKLGSV